MKQHINYIDSLKGICAIWITLAHYAIAYVPFGFVGWNSAVLEAEKASTFFNAYPFSIFTNSSFPLYTFFALISYIFATLFFNNHKEETIKKQAVKRYFRLMPPVLAITMISYLITKLGLLYNQELSALAKSHWIGVFLTGDVSICQALYSALYNAFINGDGSYCSVLWCLDVIFIGSYFSYTILLLFGKCKSRWLFYLAFFLLTLVMRNDYAAFIAGIVAADIAVTFPKLKEYKKTAIGLILFGFIVGNAFPYVWGTKWLSIITIYCITNFIMLLGFSLSEPAQKALGGKWLSASGKWSFTLILVHFPLLISFSPWVLVKMMDLNLGFALSAIISLIVTVPVMTLAVYLFYKFVELPAEKFSQIVYEKLK